MESISFPPDIEDVDELRTYLSDTDVFGKATEEGAGYLWHAFERFRITLAIAPDVSPGGRVLELGSSPYFFTRMLKRRGLDVTCANWFGDRADLGAKGWQVLSSPRSGERLEFEFDHFNIEVDQFPYPDESYAEVFFCEILEHLPMDPINALAEIHRVLEKPNGVLVLSTPNPARTENLVKMINGDNVYEPLSGYGVHGRHNREYTLNELRSLLGELGFEVERAFTAEVSAQVPDAAPSFPGIDVSDRGEYVFVVARAVGPDRWRYPDWLYQSKHAIYRAVLPDMQVGRNDDIQTSGFHEREVVADREVRWLGRDPEGRVLLSPRFVGLATLLVEGRAQPIEVDKPITLTVELGEDVVNHEISPGTGWFSLRSAVHVSAGEQEARISTDRTWRPADVGLTADERDLSVAISSVALEPVPVASTI